MIGIDIRADLRPLQRAMVALRAEQVPFAMSLALNALATGVAAAERDEVAKTFDKPTRFTANAFRIQVATKTRHVAIVAIKDIQAEYLRPYVVGGDRSLGTKRGMLAPRGVSLNQYGNLIKGKLASLRGKPGVFIGPVTTKSGKVINGVWQRIPAKTGGSSRKGLAKPRGLKLLIQFEDSTPVRKRLDFYGRAQRYARANAAHEFDIGLRRAMATARR